MTNTAFESTDPFTPDQRYIAVVSSGLSDPSSTSQLAHRMADEVSEKLSSLGVRPIVQVIELRELATDIAAAMVTTAQSEAMREALHTVENADGLIAVTPTFKGSYAGLFKSFFDLVTEDSLRSRPVLLGATGGTPRHSLVIEHSMAPLFSYLGMRVMTARIFAATDDWGSQTRQDNEAGAPLAQRIRRAATEFAEVLDWLDPKPRISSPTALSDGADSGATAELQVTPFEQLLRANE